MIYVIAVTPIVPIRQEASHPSEMVSQLLFGETAELLEASGDFYRIRTVFDQYEGWVQANQLGQLPHGWVEKTRLAGYLDRVTIIRVAGQPMTVYPGTPVWEATSLAGLRLNYGAAAPVKTKRKSLTGLKNAVMGYMNT